MSNCTMQISVPEWKYGVSSYFVHQDISAWLATHNLRPCYAGYNRSGDGYTDGKSNRMWVYVVKDIGETDASAFGIQFPECRVFLSVND